MRPLWEPSEERIKNANITRFIQSVNEKFSLKIDGYAALYQWSIDRREDFWASVWEFGNVIASQPYDKVLEDSPSMIGAKWFTGARMNYAENLLRFRDDQVALVFKPEGKDTVRMTYAELYDTVARLAKSLRDAGVVKGDRVAGYVPNMMQTVIAMLAATSIGAIWSSCSPDFGIKGVLDRFGQIQPKILVHCQRVLLQRQEPRFTGANQWCSQRIAQRGKGGGHSLHPRARGHQQRAQGSAFR